MTMISTKPKPSLREGGCYGNRQSHNNPYLNISQPRIHSKEREVLARYYDESFINLIEVETLWAMDVINREIL